MAHALLLLIQALYGPPAPVAARLASPRPAAAPCPVATGAGEVVVCARATPDQRLQPLADATASATNPLALRLPGGGSAAVAASQSQVGGFTGVGAKATLRIPFGEGRRD